MKIHLVIGNLVELLGILSGLFLLWLAPGVQSTAVSFLLYLIAWFCMLFFPHCLTHYVVGRILGVRFRFYTLAKSSVYKLGIPLFEVITNKLLVLSLKVERESLRSLGRRRLAVMFASGAVASMSLPFLVPFVSLQNLPIFYSVLLFILSIANLAFDLYYSPRAGDISRALSTRK